MENLALQDEETIRKLNQNKFEVTEDKQIKYLDLSRNQLRFGNCLSHYSKHLENLVLDNNFLFSLENFPKIKNLKLISLNFNLFTNQEIFMVLCSEKYPKLNQLSLINNPFSPIFINDGEYQQFRKKMFEGIKSIRYLDGIHKNQKNKLNK